jgi:hypothetical protein
MSLKGCSTYVALAMVPNDEEKATLHGKRKVKEK